MPVILSQNLRHLACSGVKFSPPQEEYDLIIVETDHQAVESTVQDDEDDVEFEIAESPRAEEDCDDPEPQDTLHWSQRDCHAIDDGDDLPDDVSLSQRDSFSEELSPTRNYAADANAEAARADSQRTFIQDDNGTAGSDEIIWPESQVDNEPTQSFAVSFNDAVAASTAGRYVQARPHSEYEFSVKRKRDADEAADADSLHVNKAICRRDIGSNRDMGCGKKFDQLIKSRQGGITSTLLPYYWPLNQLSFTKAPPSIAHGQSEVRVSQILVSTNTAANVAEQGSLKTTLEDASKACSPGATNRLTEASIEAAFCAGLSELQGRLEYGVVHYLLHTSSIGIPGNDTAHDIYVPVPVMIQELRRLTEVIRGEALRSPVIRELLDGESIGFRGPDTISRGAPGVPNGADNVILRAKIRKKSLRLHKALRVLEQVKDECAELESSLHTEKAKTTQLAMQLNHASEACTRLQSDLETSRHNGDQERQKSQKQHTELKSQIAHAADTEQALRTSYSELQCALYQCEAEVKRLQASSRAMDETNRGLAHNYEEAMHQNADLKAQLQEKYKSLAQNSEDIMHQNKELTAQMMRRHGMVLEQARQLYAWKASHSRQALMLTEKDYHIARLENIVEAVRLGQLDTKRDHGDPIHTRPTQLPAPQLPPPSLQNQRLAQQPTTLATASRFDTRPPPRASTTLRMPPPTSSQFNAQPKSSATGRICSIAEATSQGSMAWPGIS